MTEFRTRHRVVDRDVSYTAEAELVQGRAERSEPSVIRLGAIIFFSTATGDAWMFDINDGEAACLMRDGTPEPIPIVESETRFGVAWQSRYRLEGGAFLVVEADGTARAMAGYPVEQIRRMIDDYPAVSSPAFFDLDALRARLKNIGRNDPCPCSSGKKYKKCCQPRDESALRQGAADHQDRPIQRAESDLEPVDYEDDEPFDEDDVIELDEATARGTEATRRAVDSESETEEEAESREDGLSVEAEQEANLRWEAFDAIAQPSREQMDAHLEALLALPPQATHWNELFGEFARKEHPDLPAVFRRIVAGVPPTKVAGLSYFYWNALEKFIGARRPELVPEIVAGFCTLDRESYEADSLKHVEQWILAAGRDDDVLALTEHFLPILRADDLMPYAVPQTCRLIFEVRVGRRLRDFGAPGLDPAALAAEFHRGVEEEIHADHAQRAADVICGGAPPGPFERSEFDLAQGEVRKGHPSWSRELDRFETLLHVAREAWHYEQRPPGAALRGVWLLVDAVYDERDDNDDRPAKGKKRAALNLLDCLQPGGMERRIARSSRDVLGTNAPLAHLLLEAHADLRRFAVRHGLIDEALAAKSVANVAMLQRKLGFVA